MTTELYKVLPEVMDMVNYIKHCSFNEIRSNHENLFYNVEVSSSHKSKAPKRIVKSEELLIFLYTKRFPN